MNSTTEIQVFTRSEVTEATGLTRTQLAYLDKLNLICPIKAGSDKKHTLLYSEKQLIALKTYSKIREKCSLQSLRQAIEYLNEYYPEDLLTDKRLVVCGNKVFWIDDTREERDKIFLQISNSREAQIVFSFTISDLVEEIKKDVSNVINLADRINKAYSRKAA